MLHMHMIRIAQIKWTLSKQWRLPYQEVRSTASQSLRQQLSVRDIQAFGPPLARNFGSDSTARL